MIEIGDKIVSMDVFEVLFACDYEQCKGICCVEGDSGAPLEPGEAEMLRKYLPEVEHLLSSRAREVIAQQGVSYIDEEGDEVTSIVGGKDCVFTTYDERGNCLCAYEKIYYEGKIDWIKPISCQLYPIRLTKYKDFTAVNYHKWSVCKCALKRGRKEGIPVYQFLKGPLVRTFGEEWYDQLEGAARLLKEERSEQDK
ncbi:DUF3109 family protein [Porphyromonas sp. COT-290 OH3588]|uniref:DUF3109 family protein n=1 Tax=Porphyromonas sp. COT-290 OH3588 TaxID=1515617 RepID=UPI00052CEBE5|nr:DUF3109 family protein [Porphyromonas sp. COT-290 OH3588]KGO01063.1 hypothetical protein HQ48_02965 [Porphyromonas sp. COT-290 OH3588]